jgi:hypothetical protein
MFNKRLDSRFRGNDGEGAGMTAGLLNAIKAGITPESVRRPFSWTKVETKNRSADKENLASKNRAT